MPTSRLLTVAICTHNRAAILDDTLQYLGRARVPEGWRLEVVVVDNRSTDRTPAVIQAAGTRLPIVAVSCQELGTSHARNAAVRQASGEAIVWLDDDVRVEPGLLEAYAAALDRHPDRALFGGSVEPYFLNQPPEWVRALPPQIRPVFSIREVASADDPFERGRFPVGANVMCRTVAHREVPFDTELGRTGSQGPLGEENAFFEEVIRRGNRGIWVPAARLAHYVPPGRQTARYVANWYASWAESLEVLRTGAVRPTLLIGVPRWAIRAWLLGTIRYHFLRLVAGPESWLPALCAAGFARGVIRYYHRNIFPRALVFSEGDSTSSRPTG